MEVLLLLIPISLAISAVFVVAFLVAVHKGQFSDVESPRWRILFDEQKPNKT